MPQRIQRRRTKGYRLPANAVSVTRPGRWGNPFKVGEWAVDQITERGIPITRENCLRLFESYCKLELEENPTWLEPLRGKDLACWCKEGEPCHADILLRLANA